MNAVTRARATYNITPDSALWNSEFHISDEIKDAWKHRDGVPDVEERFWEFGLDVDENRKPVGESQIWGLGWCEGEFYPKFKVEQIKDEGTTEIVRDEAGRHVRFFKNRRYGFMPDHPVKDEKTWEEDVKWRLDPATPERYEAQGKLIAESMPGIMRGDVTFQQTAGGYMYLRSLIGPEELFYMLVDEPELIHDCMKTWFALADTMLAYTQERVAIDGIAFAEDISYNNGLLVSPDMIREFLFPYYQQLIENALRRQRDPAKKFFLKLDTDGRAEDAIRLYREVGFNCFMPFEVASGSDVIEIGQKYPDIVMSGGIDKRVLAKGKNEIDAMLERIIPAMRKRGGYIPTVDHCVPTEVPFENYLHYRKRCLELGA